jgi:hypothetical protein
VFLGRKQRPLRQWSKLVTCLGRKMLAVAATVFLVPVTHPFRLIEDFFRDRVGPLGFRIKDQTFIGQGIYLIIFSKLNLV